MQILDEMVIVGNAHSDREISETCHDIIMDESRPMSERILGCRKLDEIMGEVVEEVTEEDVKEYCEMFE